MCKSRNSKYNDVAEAFVDKCLNNIITFIDNYSDDWRTISCCCGHGKYPITIVVECKSTGKKMELFSDIEIDRKRKFYKKDSEGYYYIPEVINKLS